MDGRIRGAYITVFDHLRKIALKKRDAGSKDEKETSDLLIEHFERLGCDVETEEVEFLQSERFFVAYNIIHVWLTYLIIISPFFIHPLLSMGVFLAFLFFDSKVFPKIYIKLGKDKSTNIVASVNTDKKARLIICGHYDSGRILSKFVQKNQKLFISIQPFITILTMTYIVVMSLFGVMLLLTRPIYLFGTGFEVLSPIFFFWAFYAFFFGVLITFMSIVILTFTTKKVSYGADDNASGMAIIMAAAENLKDRTKNLRLDLACFAAEEKGLYGSRKWVNAHAKDLDRENTYVLNLDCVGKGERFFINKGLGTIFKKPSDPRLVEIMKTSCKELNYPCEESWGGGSDHYEFVHRKLKCVALYRCTPVRTNVAQRGLRRFFRIPVRSDFVPLMDWIHSESDVVENIDPERLEETSRLVMKFVEKLDTAVGSGALF